MMKGSAVPLMEMRMPPGAVLSPTLWMPMSMMLAI
jgi:hypothetical protein